VAWCLQLSCIIGFFLKHRKLTVAAAGYLRRMNRLLLLLLVGVVPFTVSAQTPDSSATAAPAAWPAPAPALTLLFSPLATLDFNTSTLLFGAEYRINSRVGVTVEYGTRFRLLQITSLGLTDNKNDFRYYKLKAEARYYLPPLAKHPHQDMYVGLQAFYIPQTYTRYKSNYVINDIHIGYERALVDKMVAGLAVNAGFIWYYKHNWQLEVGGGLGLRYISIKYQTENERPEPNVNNYQLNMFNQTEKPGSTPDFHIGVICKVGYRINFSSKK
jgi:hypothetical protein